MILETLNIGDCVSARLIPSQEEVTGTIDYIKVEIYKPAGRSSVRKIYYTIDTGYRKMTAREYEIFSVNSR